MKTRKQIHAALALFLLMFGAGVPGARAAMFTGGVEFSPDGFTFRGTGDPYARYTVEASETGEFRWTDTSAGGYRQRYYRLVE